MVDKQAPENAASAYWAALSAHPDELIPDGGLDPETASALRRLHRLTTSPPPAGAREQVDRALERRRAARSNSHRHQEHLDMNQPQILRLSPPGMEAWGRAPSTRTVPAKRVRPLIRWRALPAAGVVLLLITLGLGYLAFDPFGGPDQPSSLPAAVVPGGTPIARTCALPARAAGPAASPAASAPAAMAWTSTGDARRPLSSPGFVAVDPAGCIWVTSAPGTIFIFGPDGALRETWGAPGTGPGQFQFRISGIFGGAILFAPDGGFYVSDLGNQRIQRFDRNRRFVLAWGAPGEGAGQFLAPFGLAFDADGNLLVSDYGRGDIQRFTPKGVYLGAFGASSSEAHGYAFIATAPDGALWAADAAANQVIVFGPDRKVRFVVGGPGTGHGRFNSPDAVGFDAAGHAFVVDESNNLIQVFDLAGRFIGQFGGAGKGDGQLNAPHSVAVAPDGGIYVADFNNNRIEKFTLVGPFPQPATATPSA